MALTTVDDYVATFPPDVQERLLQIRRRIQGAVPGSGETIRYGMPCVTVDGVDKDGKPQHGVWVGKFDGKAYPVKGNLGFDSIAYKVVNDRANDITTMNGGKSTSTGRIEVSKDGKSRTITIEGTDENGKKFKSKGVYDKQ